MTESIYKRLPEAIAAGEAFLSEAPDLTFTFKTTAQGNLFDFPDRDSAKRLIDAMDNACGGLSHTAANEAFSHIQATAIQSGRIVSRYRKDNAFFTEISAVRL